MHDQKGNPIQALYRQAPEKKYKAVVTESQYLTMRDGIQIAMDVLLPAGLDPEVRLPVVLTMTRYWRSFDLRIPEPRGKAPIAPRESLADDLILRGFAMIIVDARGSGASTGINRYPWTPEEIADYGEVAAWALAQPWCNGSVGAVGISYEGTTAQLLAATGVEAVRGVVPQQIEFDVYTDIAFPGGVPNQAFIRAWSEGNQKLDSNQLPGWFPIPPWARWMLKGVRPVDSDSKTRVMLAQALLDHQANTPIDAAMSKIIYRDDPFGETGASLDDFSVFSHKAAIETNGSPIFSWGSWLDAATADTVLRTFNTFSNPQIAVIGGWSHEMTTHGSPYRKPKAKPDPEQSHQWAAIAQFFEDTLQPGEPRPEKKLFYFTLGAELWRQSDSFPIPGTQEQAWYFHAGSLLSTDMPADEAGSDRYRVNFDATTGAYNRWQTGLAKPVIYPDRVSQDRRLLTYTSQPLDRDLEVTGYPVVTLCLASTETDGAFIVYLEDVDEKGAVRYLTEGVLRGVHRQLSDETPPYPVHQPYRTFKRADAAPLPPGEMVELTFGLLPISVLFRRGHRIRVAIAGADKDTFVRIPAIAVPTLEVARNRNHASHIRLPVVP